jgi:DNA invertase Pin-like site-specific DNA recombinase
MATTKTKTKTRACGYVRVSLEKQASDGGSLDAQRAKLAAYASLYDIELVEVIVDAGQSAATLARPGLQRALGMLRKGEADALLVTKLDRLTRSVRDLGELVSGPFAPGKAALLSVGEQFDTRSAAGRLVLNILTSIGQWEREAIGERTSVVMQHMKAVGEYTGGLAPYGFRVERDRVVEVGSEQAIIRRARQLAASGCSLRAVAAMLTEEGHVSRAGRPFAAVQVSRMLAGPGSVDAAAE